MREEVGTDRQGGIKGTGADAALIRYIFNHLLGSGSPETEDPRRSGDEEENIPPHSFLHGISSPQSSPS